MVHLFSSRVLWWVGQRRQALLSTALTTRTCALHALRFTPCRVRWCLLHDMPCDCARHAHHPRALTAAGGLVWGSMAGQAAGMAARIDPSAPTTASAVAASTSLGSRTPPSSSLLSPPPSPPLLPTAVPVPPPVSLPQRPPSSPRVFRAPVTNQSRATGCLLFPVWLGGDDDGRAGWVAAPTTAAATATGGGQADQAGPRPDQPVTSTRGRRAIAPPPPPCRGVGCGAAASATRRRGTARFAFRGVGTPPVAGALLVTVATAAATAADRSVTMLARSWLP